MGIPGSNPFAKVFLLQSGPGLSYQSLTCYSSAGAVLQYLILSILFVHTNSNIHIFNKYGFYIRNIRTLSRF